LVIVSGSLAAYAQQHDWSNLQTLTATERELKGGETNSYRVNLAAGQFFQAVVEQKGIDVVVVLFGPDGKQIAESDSPNDRWGREPIVLVAAAAGDHRIDIRAPSATAAPGSYAIKIIALREATAADNDYAKAQRLFDEGRVLRNQTSATARRASLEKYEAALALFRAAGDTYRETLTLSSIGNVHARLNEFRKALEVFQQTLLLAQQLNERRLEAGIETFLGGSHDVLGEPKEALEHYERALSLSRESGNRSAEASALNNIGLIYSQTSDSQRALEYYARALELFRELGSQGTEAITLQNMGVAYNMLAEPEKALEYFERSLVLRRITKDKSGESEALGNIGLAYRNLAKFDRALEHYNEALAIQKETGNKRLEAITLGYMGSLYAEMGQPAKALDNHQQALSLQIAIENRQRQAVSLDHIARAYFLLGEFPKAFDYHNQSLVLFRTIGDRSGVARSLHGLARVEKRGGNFHAARNYIEETLALIETVRARSGSQQLRASYFASVENAYEFYVDLLMKLHEREPDAGHDAAALQVSERGRARSLVELLSEANADIRQGVGADLVRKEREVSTALNAKAQRLIQLTAQKGNPEEIATLNREISALEDEFQQIQVAIRKESPQYAALTQPQPLDLKSIQRELDQGTVLLEYSLGDEQSYLWVVTPDSLKTFQLPKREQIQSLAQQVYKSLTTRAEFKSLETPAQRQARIAQAEAQFERAAVELSRMILAPAVEELQGKRLVVVADGVLQYVPFAALSSQTHYRPLVLDHELISLPSASAFAVHRQNLRDRKPAPKSIAVVADPVFSTNDARFQTNARVKGPNQPGATRIIEHTTGTGSSQLAIPRLPFTRQEAEQILSIAPAGENLKALGFHANRNFATGSELSKYRYVHFATHGYLDTKRASLSAIVLSLVDEQGRPQDGFLRTHDIYNLNLPAELVVLSACETGLGKDVRGEGLDGITRGFMYAGARRVIVSLWNVNDKATATLMQRLYSGMLRSGKTPAAALRAAQIEMLRTRQWHSPYFWAAFVMQGEWR
jgi:CHAT domain-containing protein/tetratricopeptide (TPR) repeat protein